MGGVIWKRTIVMWKLSIIGALAFAAISAQVAAAQAALSRDELSAARVSAIHDCSVRAARYPETTFPAEDVIVYRACMAGHGQIE
jgi:hypothetical protein